MSLFSIIRISYHVINIINFRGCCIKSSDFHITLHEFPNSFRDSPADFRVWNLIFRCFSVNFCEISTSFAKSTHSVVLSNSFTNLLPRFFSNLLAESVIQFFQIHKDYPNHVDIINRSIRTDTLFRMLDRGR